MVITGQQKNAPGLPEHIPRPSGIEVQVDSKFLKHIGTAALGTEGTITVLDDTGSGTRRHKHRGRRNIQVSGPVSSGAAEFQ
jgi:hypothetical protein